MSTSKVLDTIAGTANADLSAKLHHFAKAVDGDKIDLAGDGGNVIGVIVEAAASGYGVSVQYCGIGKVVAGGAITAGDLISSDANGAANTAATGDFVVGIALNTYASGELCSFVFASGCNAA